MKSAPSPQPYPQLLAACFEEALASAGIEKPSEVGLAFVPTGNPEHGDYQTNVAMQLARPLKKNPREIAGDIAAAVGATDLFDQPEVAGPGFINVRLNPMAFAKRAGEMLTDPRLGVPEVAEAKKIIIDFSSPNVAKPMHIGHIRSTVIGDSLARVARFLGHEVVGDNHIGDWGTPMGMVIHGWKNHLDEGAYEADPVAELLRLYQMAKVEADAEPAVAEAHRDETVKLQAGDPENTEIWKKFLEVTGGAMKSIYDRLDISFDSTLGESFFDPRLAPLVEDLVASGIAVESDGALCVFSDGSLDPKEDPLLVQRDGEWVPVPCMVRKKDGGFNYATTDLATIDYRLKDEAAGEVWYVVDDRQSLHFRQVFEVSRQRGYDAELVHVAFGKILKEDGTPFQTKAGKAVYLSDVLQKAHDRARLIVDDKNPDLPEEEKETIAEVLGIASVKYAELSQARHKDYVFDWDKMLALKGNTAPYLLNAYVRTRSIFRKLGDDAPSIDGVDIVLTEPGELALMRELAQFAEVVPAVLNDHRPNLLAGYLHSLAGTFHSFYEACPIMKAEDESQKTSRLALAELTSRVLAQGLKLLGIQVTERM